MLSFACNEDSAQYAALSEVAMGITEDGKRPEGGIFTGLREKHSTRSHRSGPEKVGLFDGSHCDHNRKRRG